MKITKLFLTAALIGMLLPSNISFALDLAGLNEPESITIHSKTGDYFVSNVNGEPLGKDNNGYISKISKDGLVVVLMFIQGSRDGTTLHAPKGLVIENDILYVTDIDVVKGYDTGTGREVASIDFTKYKAQFLNDITRDEDGNLYVSDMTANRIYKIETRRNYKVRLVFQGDELGQPNGLLFNRRDKTLLVAAWSTGQLLGINPKGELSILRSDMESGLDGIASDREGTLYISSFAKGEIYAIADHGRGELKLFQSGLNTPADIYYDKSQKKLLVPLMKQNALVSYTITDRS